MAETHGSLRLATDPTSLILSQYSDNPDNASNTLQFTTDSYFIERGPRYNAYAQLRESKLRSKYALLDQFEKEIEIPRSEITPIEIPRPEITPVKKTVRFQGSLQDSGKKQRTSVLAQSTPDFSAVLRKENRRPVENRIPRAEKSATPPVRREKVFGSAVKGGGGGGSRSVNSGEKQRSMMAARKSYASIEELKGLSIAAANAINGDNRGGGGKRGNVLRKSTVLSTRYY